MLGGGIESLPNGAVVVQVGEDGFVMPWPYFRVTASQGARIEVAAMLGMAGLVLDQEAMSGERRRLLSEVEAEMAKEAKRRAKIPEGRALSVPKHLWAEQGPVHLMPGRDQGLPVVETGEGMVYAPDPYRAPKRIEGQPEPDGLAQDLVDLGAEISYRALTEAQANTRAMAEHYIERFGVSGDREELHIAQRILLKLHRELVEQEEARSVVRARHAADAPLRRWRRDTIAARRAVLDTKGLQRKVVLTAVWRLRLALRKSRVQDWLDAPSSRGDDGLKNLFENEHLTLAQYAQGMRYRRLYIATERNLRSAMGGDGGGARDDTRTAEDWGAPLADRKKLEAVVMTAAKGNGRMLTTLRLVAGEGRTINAMSKPGSGSDRIMNRKALKAALQLLVDRPAVEVGSAA